MRINLRHQQHHLGLDVHPEGRAYRVGIGDVTHHVEVRELDDAAVLLIVDGARYRIALARDGGTRLVAVAGETYTFQSESGAGALHAHTVAPPEILAPMPGKVLQVLVKAGDPVAVGDGLLILEAMKMENRLVAEAAGTVTDVRVAEGAMVDGGQVLIVLAYDE
jgi:biotin carboxyl carrier protein